MKKFLALVLALCMVFALCACGQAEAPAAAEKPADTAAAAEPAAEVTPVVLKVNMSETNTDIKAEVVAEMAKEVEEATNGAITFELHYSNELGTMADTTEQIKLGGNLMANSSGDFFADYGCYDIMSCALFYVFPTGEDVDTFSRSDLFKSWCDKISETSGIKILCCNWASAPRCIISTKPINSVEDLKGLKVRVPGLAADAFFSNLGSSTMTMAFGDIYTNMQQGMVEAAEAPLSSLYAYSLQEVAKNVYLSEHSMAPCCWAISTKIWDSLTPENQEILQNALLKYGEVYTEKSMATQDEAIQQLKDAGCTIVEPSDADKEVMKQAGADSFSVFPDMTPGLADQIAAIIAK